MVTVAKPILMSEIFGLDSQTASITGAASGIAADPVTGQVPAANGGFSLS